MERLIIHPDKTPGRFVAILEKDGTHVTVSDQPLVDGARILLERGLDGATLLAMRHADRPYDSFDPMPIGVLADITYSERKKGTLTRERWMPFPTPGGGSK